MANISGNTCGIVTILPMSVECFSSWATTPEDNDGAIYLNITGGSTPYSVTWSNGKKSINLYNLYSGSYTGTVIDYYGDYSATTICEVGSQRFYLDYFQNCDTLDYLYLTGLTSSAFTEGKVYKFTNNTGCYSYSGRTLSTGGSYTGDTLSSGPYDSCLDCNPPPAPLPYYPNTLCLSNNSSDSYIAYDFGVTNFVNDRPAYTGSSVSSSGYTISWVTGLTQSQWLVLGRTGQVLSNLDNTFNPLGTWNLFGSNETWTAVSGSCGPAPGLTATITSNNESCQGKNDGSIIITAKGGTKPYTYSIDGSNYKSFPPSFTNLSPIKNGLVYVKDSDTPSNQITIPFDILAGGAKTQYNVNISSSNQTISYDVNNESIQKMTFNINVSPELPVGVEITLNDLTITTGSFHYPPGYTSSSSVVTLTSGGTTTNPSSQVLTNTSYNSSGKGAYYYPLLITATTSATTYNTLKLKKGTKIDGVVTSTLKKVSNGSLSYLTSRYQIKNTATSSKTFTWKNATGGTETSSILNGQTIKLCMVEPLNLPTGVTATPINSENCATSSNNFPNVTSTVNITLKNVSVPEGCLTTILQSSTNTMDTYLNIYNFYNF
jgi:hypothetical protein